MPNVLIEVRRQYPPEQETALMAAVHAALRDAFKIPAHDRTIRLVTHDPHRFAVSPELAKPEAYTLVTIEAFSGRSLEAKRTLYREIVGNLERLAIPKDHVTIVLHEIPTENWGIRGGQAASDVELGFKVDV
ncbi:MAG: tautomerase family protein [Armatimonadetes bacterium]|nr:tautomerase family protein [Armatimonadota bacterium]MBS1702356.1 tautomerase family protein [Armatimonadota bacterium]MBS1725784.1 tautomerase family protein [Armatimonadota bacterium]